MAFQRENNERMFRVIYETNYKENETFLHYCQYTGNEKELDMFCDIINHACFDELDGDVVKFYVGYNKLIPESAVDAHIGLDSPNGYAHMFQKHTGKFKCPRLEAIWHDDDDEEINLERARARLDNADSHRIARELDEWLYSTKIVYYFSDYKERRH